jgi:MarR family transcriptional regulator, organic hydroperoxide resistance regulator
MEFLYNQAGRKKTGMAKHRTSSETGTMVDPLYISITKRLRQIAHNLDKHSKFLQERFRVTVPQVITLREIYEHGPLSFTQLTEIVSLNNSTVTGIVDRLERRGWVRRERTSADRRRIDIAITKEGIDFLQTVPPPIQQSLIEGLERMDQEEVDTILWSIDTLLALLHDDDAVEPSA